jgi:hypothetical protein
MSSFKINRAESYLTSRPSALWRWKEACDGRLTIGWTGFDDCFHFFSLLRLLLMGLHYALCRFCRLPRLLKGYRDDRQHRWLVQRACVVPVCRPATRAPVGDRVF